MTGRDWKPGDVLVRDGVRGFVTTGVDGGEVAEYVAWSDGDALLVGELPDGARPLVAIDPEDPAQVERLVAAFWANGTDDLDDPAAMQAALRSLVTPPKPEEPTGLGAVVEDAEGGRWVRCRGGHRGLLGVTWENERTCAHEPWPYIAAVRVLSEGVTA